MSEIDLEKESEEIAARSARIVSLYELAPEEKIKDITDAVLANPETKDYAKKNILAYGRRIFLFSYPSDGLQVKGFVSFTPQSSGQPLIIFLRGGNRLFGLPNPGTDLVTYKNYISLATLYRGGVSEGVDEFGGADVHDVKHLIDFIPELEKRLCISLSPNQTVMLGSSRGGMEMFLSLARYPELQNRVDKVISLSGLLDMQRQIEDRDDMRTMFMQDFGFQYDIKWIHHRNPILTVPFLKASLPILIIQGTNDPRVHLAEGHHMIEKLKENGNLVTYWEIEGGKHCLSGNEKRMNLIADWIEKE